MREAIEPLGWGCAFANDIAPKKAEMYRDRFGHSDLSVADVHDISAVDIPAEIDLFTASFPCVDLSLAGNRQGIDGADSGAFWPFMNLLAEYCDLNPHPRGILLENVAGFVSSNGGEDLYRAISALNELGYRCDIVQVDAKWFVPQSRPRVFVIGLRADDVQMKPFPALTESRVRPKAIQRFLRANSSLDLGSIDLPEPPNKGGIKLAPILEDVSPGDSSWWPSKKSESLVRLMAPRHQERVSSILVDGGGSVGAIYRRVRNGKTVGEIRTDGIAGCLRTPSGGSSIQFVGVPSDGKLHIRNLTGREYARLQGVPDDFPIRVPERQAMYGFGDAVCVPAVRWLVDHALGHLLEKESVTVGEQAGGMQVRMMEARSNGERSTEEGFTYPHPQPTSDPFTIAERSEIMRKVKSYDTAPEPQLRKAQWKLGLRYRLNAKDLPGKPDIVFRGDKLAVFVDGEFWHGKKLSAERLSQMKPYWRQKIDRNVERDQAVNDALTHSGWRVIRIGSKLIDVDRSGIAHLISSLLREKDVTITETGIELYRPIEHGASVDA